MKTVGTSPPRSDGYDKVTGRTKYIDDLSFPGMLYGSTIRSTVAHARIQRITLDPSFDWSDITCVDSKDIPGENTIALIQNDQPCLADKIVNHVAEPILLLACEDRKRLIEASRRIKIDYEPLPAVFDPLEALRKGNVLKRLEIQKGDLKKGFAESDVVVEGEYRTHRQEHVYIETNGAIAVPQADGGVTVYGSLQCPYYVHKSLKVLFGLPDEKIRVVQTMMGGAFGGKEDYPSILAAHAALLARKSGRPVKIVYGREEDMAATTKRHPSIVRHRTGLKKDGSLVAMEIEIILDGGAYTTLSPVVLSRASIHATGPYRCPNVKISGAAVATNTPPNGAFRGFGAPQAAFAYERQMDRCARALNMNPLAFRGKNLLREGDTTATGQRLSASVGALAVFDRVVKLPPLHKNPSRPEKARGRGYSFFWHGGGFTGDGEMRLKGKVGVELLPGGRVKILSASTEMGQGKDTVLSQIAADTLEVPLDGILLETPDTALVPDSGPTVASRTTMVVGGIVQECCKALREAIQEFPGTFAQAADAYLAQYGSLRIVREFSNPAGAVWDDHRYQGDAYAAYSWGANVADVEVDLDTFETRVEKFWTIAEAGKAIHPVLTEGQLEGGTVQGIGYGLLEQVVMQNGRMVNTRITDYLIPTSVDAPEIETILLEDPYPHGPFGAKGIGELPHNGPAPAVVSAIEDATGISLNEIPATPERLAQAKEAR